MKLGSLFDGSGTAPLAAAMCGIEPVWASEIEAYPIKVTTARFPNMKHLGDITKINGAEVGPVDVLCGGSPCQDLSVAGKQKGLQDGERSHLFFEMTRIIKEMRAATDGKYPRYIIWENVPGAFSSNNGRDFHAVLQAFAEIADPNVHVPEPPRKGKTDRLAWRYAGSIVGDGWSIAWRTVDAQYWGVPQRRRRIYLVADFASECAGEILFERKSLSGDTESSRTSRKETTADAGRSLDGSGGVICLNDQGGNVMSVSYGYTATLRAQEHGHQPIVVAAAFVGRQGAKSGSTAFEIGIAPTLRQGITADCVYCIEGDGNTRAQIIENVSPCMKTVHPNVAVYGLNRKYIVRRLTPLECCRLQGFPDWWEDGVEGSDSARYKMWGNGMALPNMLHVMRGIARVEGEGCD